MVTYNNNRGVYTWLPIIMIEGYSYMVTYNNDRGYSYMVTYNNRGVYTW